MSTSTVPGNVQPQALSLHKVGTAPNTQDGGGLPVLAVGMGSKGKERDGPKTLCRFPLGVENRPWLKETQVVSSMQDTQCQVAQPLAGLFLNRYKSLHTTWLGPETAHWDALQHCKCSPIILHLPICATFSFFLHILCNSWQGLSDTF